MSFSIDGQSAASLNVKLMTEYEEPGLPEIREKRQTVPGRAGQYDFGSEYDTRTINLPLVTVGTSSESEVQDVIRNLANVLTDENGDPKEVKLTFDKESDKHYKVKFNGDFGVPRINGGIAKFTLTLVATEPFAFGDTNTTTVNVTSSGQTFSVTNSGSAPTPVKVTITNTGTTTISGFSLRKS